ncbi:hypothetical protein M9Y10_002479 [Tritrichomonas musculus]|uniref:Surface antigen BspA-like n=1 Tax=Tritrichomonas musculus TaxID=1915356 RepID=A0ABR2LAZ3_9EUKA
MQENVNYVGENVFNGCKSLENVIFCTSLITKISSNCSSLSQIEIPSSVTIIESSVFSGCTSLSKIKFHSSLTIIESFTFYNCESLVTFEVPSSGTTIERYTFLGCSTLPLSLFLQTIKIMPL